MCGGLADCLGQLDGIEAGLWWLVVGAGAVEADECVEVDDAAALEFRDFHKRDPASPAELGCSEAGPVGEGATQSDGESAPQFRGVPVERDMRRVVVTVGADGLPEARVVLSVNCRAPGGPSMWA